MRYWRKIIIPAIVALGAAGSILAPSATSASPTLPCNVHVVTAAPYAIPSTRHHA